MIPLVVDLDPDALRREMEQLGVDPPGVAIMAAKASALCVKIFGIPCAAANIIKQSMLSAGGDAAVPRGVVSCKLPKTDMLLIGTRAQVQRAFSNADGQPFRMKRLAEDVLVSLRNYDHPPQSWAIRDGQVDLARPVVMGVLNVTPDSFSDGGTYATRDAALARARQMIAEGADLIDIGGESTRPGAHALNAGEEVARVLPVITQLAAETKTPLSIDTRKAAVAGAALAAGAHIVNDVSALGDTAMAPLVRESGAGLVLMHMHGAPETMQAAPLEEHGIVDCVAAALQERLAAALDAGIAREHIALDPGIGFGKTFRANEALLCHLDALRSLGAPVLIGVSRKRFIGERTGRAPQERLAGSLAAQVIACLRGARIIRTHDVKETKDALAITHAITNEKH